MSIKMISLQDIELAQARWGEQLISIGSLKNDLKARQDATVQMLNELYDFDTGEVLFKPTKASKVQFRLHLEGAMSYFIGGNDKYGEDEGFALQPWVNVQFQNTSVILNANTALAMGNYFFTDPVGVRVKVEYTFSYIRCTKDIIKINLHHSSFPYNTQ